MNRLPYQLLSKKSEGNRKKKKSQEKARENNEMITNIATKDPEFIILEKQFTEFSKLIEVFANDARTFRDSIACKKMCKM